MTAIDEIFHEVEGGVADFGVVPIENSSEGTVNHTLDMFLTSGLKICGEVELRISHYLMGKMSGFEAIKRDLRPSASLGAMPRLAGRSAPRGGARGRLQQCRRRAARAR